MQRLIKFLGSGICIVLYLLNIDARCQTEITCNDMTNCYMIYAQSNDWYYYHRRSGENNKNIGGNPPSSPSTYILKRVSTRTRSLFEIERECQEFGANIIMINSDQEYDQLTENILHVLSYNQKSIFSTKVSNLPQESASSTCGRVTVKDTILNEVDININQCHQDQIVNSILCESNPNDVVVCPHTTTVTPTNKITTPVKMVTIEAATSSNPTPELTTTGVIVTSAKETAEREQTPDTQLEKQPLKQSNELSTNTMLFIVVPVSVAVLLFFIAITCFIVGRRKKKRTRGVTPSNLGVESNNRESNIYADEVVLLNGASVSLNVASEMVNINSERHYENASDRVASQDTESRLDDNHYNVPKEQNFYEYLSYQSSENKPIPDQPKEVHFTEHYSVPRPNVNKPPNECIYQEPSQAGDDSVIQNNNYDVPKLSGKENDADNCSNLYNESELGNTVGSTSDNYDTPKSINVKNECNGKKQNSGKVAKKPPVKPPRKDLDSDSVDQYDTPTRMSKKTASARHTPLAKPALKPPTTQSKSQNTVRKNNSNRAENRQKYKVPSKYDIPLSHTNGDNSQEQQALKQSSASSGEVYAIPNKAVIDHEYARMDKAHKTEDEQYYSPKSDTQYENYCGETQNKQENPEAASSTLHYDVPRTANEYESFDGMDKDQTQGPISTEHYDVPRVPNVYEQCDDNVKKQPVQTLHVSNALYETLGDDDKIKSSKKSKKTGKQKKEKSQTSKTVGGYMSYECEQQNADHYQELDKSASTIIKFR